MNLSAIVARPVATTLISLGIALFGLVVYPQLTVAPLPQVDFPTILVQAQMPGASPETMATSVAPPSNGGLGKLRPCPRSRRLIRLGCLASRCSLISIATSTVLLATFRLPSMPLAPICRPACAAIRRTGRSIRQTFPC